MSASITESLGRVQILAKTVFISNKCTFEKHELIFPVVVIKYKGFSINEGDF